MASHSPARAASPRTAVMRPLMCASEQIRTEPRKPPRIGTSHPHRTPTTAGLVWHEGSGVERSGFRLRHPLFLGAGPPESRRNCVIVANGGAAGTLCSFVFREPLRPARKSVVTRGPVVD